MRSIIEDDKLFIENGPTNIVAEVFSSEKKENHIIYLLNDPI